MTTKQDEKIKALELKLAQAKALKAKQEAAARARASAARRTADTRRKVLAGALVLDMMERDEQTRAKFLDRLDKYLTRADDRALFDLPAVQPQQPAPA